jgi:hypothetical protein
VVVGVMALISQNTRFIISAEERLLAAIAADNLMTAEMARRAVPGAGVEDGVVNIASYEFSYSKSVVDLSGDLAQIEFVVRSPHGEQNIARIMALKGER